MKNIRATILATLVGVFTFTGTAQPVYAQKMFVDQTVTQTPVATADSELKKVLPLLTFGDVAQETIPQSDDNGMFTTFFVDNTSVSIAQKPTGTEKTMPIATDDVVGISTFFSRFHPGIDIRAKVGTTIHAVLPGIVNEVSYEAGGYGRYAILVHHVDGKTFFSLYAHMKKTVVAVGDMLGSGDEIGEVGLTGHTTGPHLHFEIHNNQTAIDPIKFFAGNAIAMAKK